MVILNCEMKGGRGWWQGTKGGWSESSAVPHIWSLLTVTRVTQHPGFQFPMHIVVPICSVSRRQCSRLEFHNFDINTVMNTQYWENTRILNDSWFYGSLQLGGFVNKHPKWQRHIEILLLLAKWNKYGRAPILKLFVTNNLSNNFLNLDD